MTKLKGKRFEIDGKIYKLIKHLKDGGNSSIWVAEFDNKKFAVKILNEESDNKKERFKKEIEFCKSVKHDNLISIYSHGEINNKLCYVMELYNENLADLIKFGINFETCFNYIFQICSALEFLHNHHNVTHRDLKPENILVYKGKLVLADLGIAHFENSSITSKNDLLANRGYAAPEQKIKGLSKDITTAVDIFSLGLMINEIFTRKKPEGSNFTLISDMYPWLIDIDGLVERCTRQNPAERPNIKEVSLELKLKFNELKDEITSIKENLEEHFGDLDSSMDYDSEIKEKIINQASNDILTAKYFFENKTTKELEKYNHNYNCNVHYKLDTGLRRDYMKYLLRERCKGTFLYESGVYKNSQEYYVPLNLGDNPKDKKLYKKFFSFLKDNFIVDGELLKLFSSCCDYHCEEIIQDLEEIKKKVADLDDAPILYIVMHIINIKDNNADIISCENKILVNWEKSISNYDNNSTYMGLLKKDNREKEEVLNAFIKKYNAVVTNKDNGFLVRFENEKLYDDFKKYALELSKKYYIFNGDVLDLVRVEKEYEGIIELKLWNEFDIKNTLSKIMGFRKDY